MRMNKKLKNLLVVGMAASFVLNSAAGVVFAEELGTEVETEVSTETETPDESAGWDSETVEESLTDGITVYSAPEDLTGAPATLAVYYKTADGVMVSAKVIQREQEDLTATEYTFTTEDLTVPEGYRCVGEFSQTVAYGGHGQATVTVELDTVEAKPATLAVYYKTADGVMVSAKVIQREQEDLTATEYTFTTEDLTVPEGYRCVGEFSQTVAYGGHGQATVTVELDTVETKPATLAVYYKTADGVMVSAKVIQREQEDLTATEYTFTTEDLTVPEGYRCVEEFSQTVAYGDHVQVSVTVELEKVEDKAATLTVKYWNGTEYLPGEVLVSPITGHDAYYQFDIPTELKQIPEGYEVADKTVRAVLVPYGETMEAVVAVKSIVKDEAATLTVKYWNGTEYLPSEVLVSPITGHDAYYQFDIPTELKQIPAGYKLTDTTVRPVLVPYGETREAVVAVVRENEEPVDANALLRVIYKDGDEIVWTEHVVSEEKGHEGTYEFKVPADLADVPDGYEVADAEEYTVEVAYGDVEEIEVAVTKAVKDEAATLTVKYWNGTEYLPEEVLVSPITGHDAYYQFDIPTELKQIPEGYELTDTTVRPVLVPYGETKTAVVAVRSIVKDEAATLTVKYWNGTEYLPEEVLVSPITGHDAYYQFDIPTDLKKIPEGYRLTDTTVRPVLVPYGEAKTAVVAVTKEGGEPVDANALLRVIYKSGDEIVWTEHVVSREKGHEGTYEFKVPADLADVPDGYEVADAEEYTVEVAYGNVKEIEVAVKKAVKDEAATLTVKYWNGTEYLPEEVLVSPITGHDAYYQFDIPTDLKQIPEGYKLTDTTVRPVLVPYGETRQAVVAVEKIPAETETPSTETPVTETPSTETPSTETPVTETPSTETPSTETPVTETPSTETPSTETPVTEAPSTEAPAAETPVVETPSTEKPDAEETEEETDAEETEKETSDTKKAEAKTEKKASADGVETGDTTAILPYVVISLASLLLIIAALFFKRRSAR